MLKYQNKDKIEIGLDESGRGCLFGRIYGCAVIYPKEGLNQLDCLINDSKKLTKKKREELYKELIKNVKYSVSYCDNDEIDNKGIQYCNYKIFHDSINKLNLKPDKLLVDGKCFNPYNYNNCIIDHECIIKGDSKYLSIASASIIAKVEHDNYIKNLLINNEKLNKYKLSSNMGYGTKEHINAIKLYGLSEFHRKSYKIKN
jgi:ribonuclease HII